MAEDNKKKVESLACHNVSIEASGKILLQDINVKFVSGELIAIMGPSGSGKTTLLQALSGRDRNLKSGRITLNDSAITKNTRRKISFIPQKNVYFTNLTLKQTMNFAVNIKLPKSVDFKEKQKRVDDVLKILDLSSCKDTIMGGTISKGLSEGEIKRTSIAIELLNEPSILILDEPLSGLDSAIALKVTNFLKALCIEKSLITIMSIHQPSTQIFYTFDKLCLLLDGEQIYRGSTKLAMEYFEEIGFTCHYQTNPADFILEKLKEKDFLEIYHKNLENKMALSRREYSEIQEVGMLANETAREPCQMDGKVNEMEMKSVGQEPGPSEVGQEAGQELVAKSERVEWQTSFFCQVKYLLWRNLIQQKHFYLNPWSLFRIVIIALIVGVVWLNLPYTLNSLRDREGITFFNISVIFFYVMGQSINLFPREREIFVSERSSGYYRVSSYYMGKILSEMPLSLFMPSIYYAIVFWMVHSNRREEYMKYIYLALIIMLLVLTSQAVSFMLSNAFKDIRLAENVYGVYGIFNTVLGGFHIRHIPIWINWSKYLSITRMVFEAMMRIEFSEATVIKCQEGSTFAIECMKNVTTANKYLEVKSDTFNLPLWANISILFAMGLSSHLITYIFLRKKQPK